MNVRISALAGSAQLNKEGEMEKAPNRRDPHIYQSELRGWGFECEECGEERYHFWTYRAAEKAYHQHLAQDAMRSARRSLPNLIQEDVG